VWKVAGPLLSNPPKIASYAPGSWGPAQARKLVEPGHWLLGQ
jgi:glucose-6-phosphate 1-dehydrogenase